MVNPKLYSPKPVIPAILYHKQLKIPEEWHSVVGDLNYSILISGRTGSGKDCVTTYVMNQDYHYDRTVIILDTKMEYPCAIFAQQDVVLKNILQKNGLAGRGYPVVLWIPYFKGMERNDHFKQLLSYHHPNLEIRPYRMRIQDFASEDSYNMSLAKTLNQSMGRSSKLSGQSRMGNEMKEEMGRERMGFDKEEIWEPGCGWQYLNLEEMTNNKKINVVSTLFMSINSVTSTSYMIGIMNDLLAIGKSIHKIRGPKELFTVIIPEVEILLPKNVKSLDQVVNTLRYSIKIGLKLMRSFGVRFRMNLQNLSSLDPDMISQCIPLAGRTWNAKDLNLLGVFGISKTERMKISKSAVGEFRKVIGNQKFSAVPFSHKAREMEYFVVMMKQYYADPSSFLFETKNYFLSEIINYHEIFYEGVPLSVPEYNHRVKKWLKSQRKRKVKTLPSVEDEEEAIAFDADQAQARAEELMPKISA